MKDYICPSILSANFANLGEDVRCVLDAGADMVHFDIMDNHYVPNLSFGAPICQALRNFGISATIDVHLMTKPVDSLIRSFSQSGANIISFHPDATGDVSASLRLIKECGCQSGLAVSPDMELSAVSSYISKIDTLIIMSVYPGFGGQKFIPETMQKISQARALLGTKNSQVRLVVDGGVKNTNIADIKSCGANAFVMGSAIFGQSDYVSTIADIRRKLDIKV